MSTPSLANIALELPADRIMRCDTRPKKAGRSKAAVKKAVKRVGSSRKRVERRLGR
jgi:Protein of unknown function (DUF3606)